MNPVFTHNIWGGTKLREEFGYAIEGDDIGECWGIAAHPNGTCTIADGAYKGKKLSDLWEEHKELFGNIQGKVFPLLIKIIDAKADLSIQVHPDDTYAAEHEKGSLGKMECWYILDCEPDSKLVIGHNAKTHEELEDMVHNGRWSELIREVPVKKGDFIRLIRVPCMRSKAVSPSLKPSRIVILRTVFMIMTVFPMGSRVSFTFSRVSMSSKFRQHRFLSA